MADTENVSETIAVEAKVAESKEVSLDAEPTIVPAAKVSKELQAQIVKQVEYYFGDANLARDKFLSEEITKDNGWVTLELLLKFKRMQVLTTDPEVVCAALDTSDEGLIEIGEDRSKIRRHPERPLPEQNEETRKECISRTAYVKGFPLDVEMSDLIEFFEDHQKVVNIVMRKYMDKPTKVYKFKGSVFVTFLKKEQCDEFLKKEDLKFKEAELVRLWQDDYYASKKGEREAEKKKKVSEGKIQFFVCLAVALTNRSTMEMLFNGITKINSFLFTRTTTKLQKLLSQKVH